METRTYLGKKPQRVSRNAEGKLDCQLPPQLDLSMPVMFSAMSYGSISYNAHKSLALAATELGILTIPAKAVSTRIFTVMVKIPSSRSLPDVSASMKSI